MADYNFQKFLSNFDTGIARPNRYRVEFTLPPGVSNSNTFVDPQVRSSNLAQANLNLNGGRVNVKCFSSSLPQRTILTSEKLQNSGPFRVPYSGSSYDSVTFGFYADNNMDTRQYFDLWQNTVLNVRSNTMNFYNEFVAPVYIYSLDQAGNDIYGVRLEEAYPTQISPLQLNYSTNNAPAEIYVSIQYRRWAELSTLAGRQGG